MTGTIYDFPRYYDILFGWDRSAEAHFYAAVFERHGIATGARVAEVACGTGQVARLLACNGWRVTGIDIRESMLEFFAAQARADGSAVDTVCASMESVAVSKPFDAAVNPMSSFRLLTSAAADAHLRAMAATLLPGGVYVLDMAFVETEADPGVTTNEAWRMQRGDVTVEATDACVNVEDRGVRRTLAWGAETHLRSYTYPAFAERVATVATFEIVSLHAQVMGVDGIGRFDVDRRALPPAVGRTMVVLKRING